MLGLGSWVSFLHVHPLLYELTHLWLQGPSHIDDHCIQLDIRSSHVSRCLPNISPWMSTQVSCSARPKLAPDVSLQNLFFSTQFMILFYGSCTLSVAQIKNLRLLSSSVYPASPLSAHPMGSTIRPHMEFTDSTATDVGPGPCGCPWLASLPPLLLSPFVLCTAAEHFCQTVVPLSPHQIPAQACIQHRESLLASMPHPSLPCRLRLLSSAPATGLLLLLTH